MSDPQCACGEYWPGQGHPPDCPVQQVIDRLRARVAELENERDGLRIQHGILNNDYVDLRARVAELENERDEWKVLAGRKARMIVRLRAALEDAKDPLHEETEMGDLVKWYETTRAEALE